MKRNTIIFYAFYGLAVAAGLYAVVAWNKPTEQKVTNDMQKAICIGGPIDGQYAPVDANGNETFLSSSVLRPLGTTYTRQQITVNGEVVLFFYVSEEVKINSAIHQVFARYTKKGK